MAVLSNLDGADILMKKMERERIHPDIRTLGTLMDLHAKSKFVEIPHVQKILRYKERKNVRGNLVFWNCALHCAARAGNTPLAERIVKEMFQDGIWPDVKTYNSLINAYAKTSMVQSPKSDIGRVMEILSLMKTKYETRPNVISYTVAISACAKAGDVKTAQICLQEMEEMGLKPDAKAFNTFLDVCARQEPPNTAEMIKIMIMMENSGISPDYVTASIVAKLLDAEHCDERDLGEMRGMLEAYGLELVIADNIENNRNKTNNKLE
mmetsp:Transcript_26886/g.47572  ORF Transcript_26886/g.47572 Transcript_26886/m.47572 type:complete len:266 (+) Transcript_26886:29-826(+)